MNPSLSSLENQADERYLRFESDTGVSPVKMLNSECYKVPRAEILTDHSVIQQSASAILLSPSPASLTRWRIGDPTAAAPGRTLGYQCVHRSTRGPGNAAKQHRLNLRVA